MTVPIPNAAKPQRRWFQYSLRTLLIGVALLAVPCAYVGWQAKIVRERKAWLEAHPQPDVLRILIMPSDSRKPPSPVRRWLGDQETDYILVEPTEKEAASKLFPEAWLLERRPDRTRLSPVASP